MNGRVGCQEPYQEKMSSAFDRNTVRVNSTIANIPAFCSIAVLLMVALSLLGFFEFGTTYMIISYGVIKHK